MGLGNCRCVVIPKLSQAEIREKSYERPMYPPDPPPNHFDEVVTDILGGLALAGVLILGGLLCLDVLYTKTYGHSLLLEILNSIGWL